MENKRCAMGGKGVTMFAFTLDWQAIRKAVEAYQREKQTFSVDDGDYPWMHWKQGT